ncbi:major capsid protein [Burkholderia pseudomallei]|uniref:major capsid protein n=1 Tax=Burkholderia pseudomallei TaxID=28450 RepID=UPI00193DA63B|nr:major capsid protein [Burkholderia pseudomallei]QRM23523.1 major capsid protein [Burkholderia pseudomallei]
MTTTVALPNISQTRLGINPVLTKVAQGFTNGDLVGSELFPRIDVPTRAGQIIQYGKEAFRQYNMRRSPGAAIQRVSLGFNGQPYALFQDALGVPLRFEIYDEARAIADVDLQAQAVQMQFNIMLLGLERDQAILATTASNYNSSNVLSASSTEMWSDPACNPITAVQAAREAVRSKIGRYPNKMVIGAKVFSALKTNPALNDKLKYTSSASITTDMLANWFDIKKVVVAMAVESTDENDTLGDVWGNNAILAYVPEGSTTIAQPSYGYTYQLAGMPMVRDGFVDENINSLVFNMFFERNAYITSKDSGFLFQNLV